MAQYCAAIGGGLAQILQKLKDLSLGHARNADGHWRASEQLLPRGTFPAAAMQAGTLERLARPALVACCKRLGVWTTGKAVAQMKEALGGAFELALAQHREAQQRGAAGAAALERLAAAAQATRDG